MIAWWGWVLIWAGLVLALLALVAFFAWRHIRRFFALLEDFFALTEKLSVLDAATGDDGVRPASAVLRDSHIVRREFGERMDRRRSIRQARREARLRRAKIIISADVVPPSHEQSREKPHVG